ncbi:MAG TPA: insulinase family protein, partial [Faecalibacterium sp.]|nr:insulinase family protein [Faecalibacterium sp.]
LLSGMQGVEDTLGGIETWYYIEVLRGGDPAKVQTPAEARAALQAVTKDDVRAILRKLTLSVSYLLTKEVAAHAAE